METREVLEKMLAWVKAEIEKAELPYQEPFQLTSLSFCAHKVADFADAEKALELLHATAKIERQVRVYDAVEPYVAIFLINRTIATN